MEDITGSLSLEGPVANDRWTIEHFYLHPEIGKMEIWFSDIFNGNEDLSKYKQMKIQILLQNILYLTKHLLAFTCSVMFINLIFISNKD